MQVAESHAVGHDMGTHRLVEGGATGTATTAEFEAVAVLALAAILQITCVPGPTMVDDHRVVHHVKVPVVVAVGPGATAVELSAGAGEELAGKAVGIAAVVAAVIAAQVGVLVGVAVDDLVAATVGIVRIVLRLSADGQRLRLLNGKVLVHAYLQTGIVVPTEHAALDDVVRPLHLHTVVLSVLQHQSVERPVVG